MTIEFKRQEIFWEDLEIGSGWTTRARTISEADLVGFVNLAWLTEPLFTNHHNPTGAAQRGRLVPGSMVYAMAEGLTLTEVAIQGFALLDTRMEVRGPTFCGDTVHVRASVAERRATSKPDRGITRFDHEVFNQKGEVVLAYSALRMLRRRG